MAYAPCRGPGVPLGHFQAIWGSLSMLDYLQYWGIHIERARRLLVALLLEPYFINAVLIRGSSVNCTNMLSKIVFMVYVYTMANQSLETGRKGVNRQACGTRKLKDL